MPRLLLILPTHTYQADAYMAAATRLGVDLTVASEVDSTFSSSDNEGLLTLDIRSPAAAAATVASFAEQNPIDAVLGVDDETAMVAAHVAERLSLQHSSPDAVQVAGDKLRQREVLSGADVRVPWFTVVDAHDLTPPAITQWSPYPLVLKPISLAASRGVIRVDNDAQYGAAVATIRAILSEEADEREGSGDNDRVLVEQYVPGKEFAVEGTVIDGTFFHYCVFEKPDPLEGPYFEETLYITPPRIAETDEQRIVETVRGAVAALGLTWGPVHAEVRVNHDGAWVIEVAARPIGGKCGRALRFVTDDGPATLEDVNLRLAFGQNPVVPDREAQASGVMMIPIPQAGELAAVDGVASALEVPRVSEVVITVPLGATLRQLPYESRYLGFIFAAAETSDEVEKAIRDAHAALKFTIT